MTLYFKMEIVHQKVGLKFYHNINYQEFCY